MTADATPGPHPPADTPTRSRPRWLVWLGVSALVLAGGIAWGESAGWPFLAAPVQRWLSSALNRDVALTERDATRPEMRVRFIGGLRLQAGQIRIAAPDWSPEPHLLLAYDASMRLGYLDLWRAYRGGAMHVRSIEARELDLAVERLPDGRASWQFGADPEHAARAAPSFGTVKVKDGALRYRDAVLDAAIDAHFSLLDGNAAPEASRAASSSASAVAPAASAVQARGLRVVANGRYRGFPVKGELQSGGVLPWVASDGAAQAVPVSLEATIGRAVLSFKGSASDALRLGAMKGAFSIAGPSLAAVGDPVGITLPSTPAFRAEGVLAREGKVWNAVIESARIGTSRLNGAFTYDTGRAKPLLSGKLGGSRLMLADLGPSIGAGAPARADRRPGRALPDRAFDLPSLRAMDANVAIEITEVDLNTSYLEPLKPLRAHLVLSDGVLRLDELDARTAQGRLGGSVQFDGRAERALWTAALHWNDVRLERWIRQPRTDGGPPYVSGRLRGTANLSGEGRSTAQIMASLNGKVAMQLQGGTVSHLVIEAAGIDIAQALGLVLRGDKSLTVNCGVADLQAQQGVLRPRVFVLDTDDSAVWVDGSVSLVDETLALRAVVSPKDFSPLALRTPVHVRGVLSKPQVSLEKGPLARRLGAAALMALITPAAALLPLIDPGDPDAAKAALAKGCKSLVERSGLRRAPAGAPRAKS